MPPKAACRDGEAVRKASKKDRLLAWFFTGPVGRVVAFFGDLGAALCGWALRRSGLKQDPK